MIKKGVPCLHVFFAASEAIRDTPETSAADHRDFPRTEIHGESRDSLC